MLPGTVHPENGRPRPGRFPVVAIVSSAGGLAATGLVLAGLPAGLPAAVIVLQHISPTYPSLLPEILRRHTALPVAQALDGEPLEPGRVVVAPPGHHLLVTADRRLALIESGPTPPPRPSADLLLTSLALACGPDAIAVVLSGHGTDGATGATAVHRFGGTVVASDAASSDYFSMPQAVISRDDIVDHVLAVSDMAALLSALVRAPAL
ncbi:chemotaxis protein CheB [Actinomadura sp. ATCC 31491]|uniref:protein-glutamate methylesterase n=1 Tax=Actinomadura luzonensis TaxID=2805427 RepID=A0ABT0G310_9ACTN|nr:chemotaxis protein CheB [Actinomadura luzonensis]MCK2218987.1 chemotaxis protein CheB [Actinomadura luzonensis]